MNTEKLTISHLAPYLSYGLMCLVLDEEEPVELMGIEKGFLVDSEMGLFHE